MELYQLTAHELHDKLLNEEISAIEVVESLFTRIEAVESDVKSYITLTKEEALKQAEEIDEKLANGEDVSDLVGIPVALKDNLSTTGIRTTCASKILHNYQPPYDATVVENLTEAGAIFPGKTNLDEFAMGSSTENSAFQTTKNPWDLERVPGGSSGGSAAAVAADEAIMAIGSDTGGSIRQPAALCGVVGLKPTYGLVSRYGLVAFASSLDQIGPITKDVTDCAILLNHLAGHDEKDSTSADVEVPDYKKSLKEDVEGLKIGVPKEYFGEGIDDEVKEAVWDAIDTLEDLGAEAEEVSMPHTDYALSAYYLLAPAEASSNLARYDGVEYGLRNEQASGLIEMYKKTRGEGFGDEVKRRIMLGTYALSSGYYDAYYKKAQKVRTLVKKDFEKAFEDYDVLISPTTPATAFKIGDKTDDPLAMYLNDACTIPVNLAGIPAMSIPCGVDSKGLPIGLQIFANNFEEDKMLQVAYTFEQASEIEAKAEL